MNAYCFKKLSNLVAPFDYMDYRQFLGAVHNEIKKTVDEPWNYHLYSEWLGLGKGNASHLIISGKRDISPKNAKETAKNLGLKNDARKYYLALITYQTSKNMKTRKGAFEKILQLKSENIQSSWGKKSLVFFKDWYFSAIYEILSIPEAKDDPEWLSKHLSNRVSKAKIENALKHMEDMNLLDYDKKLLRLAPTENTLSTGAEVWGVVFQSYHQQMIQRAQEALINEDGFSRDVSSVTITVNEDDLDVLKTKIAEFRKEILAFATDSPRKSKVMQLNLQLFPLSKEIKTKELNTQDSELSKETK